MSKHIINGVEYELVDNGAVFVNGVQVLIPAEGLDVFHDVHELYEHINGEPALVDEFQEAVDSADPDAVAALDTTETIPEPRTLHWKGFNVTESLGHEYGEGGPWVEVKHEDSSEAKLFNRVKARATLKPAFIGSGTYSRLCAQAALAWFDEFEPEWRGWKSGDLLRHENGSTGIAFSQSMGLELLLVNSHGDAHRIFGPLERADLNGWHRI